MLIISLMGLTINMAEARVFCHDKHATSWQPLGFSCTITCNTIFNAIDRLKQIDYRRLVNEHGGKTYSHNATNTNKYPLRRGGGHDPAAEDKYAETYYAFMNIQTTKQFLADFKAELLNMTSMLNMTCYVTADRSRLLRKVLNDCTKGDGCKGCILKSFLKLFTKNAHPHYPFDASMTLIILKHILSNVNFRYGNMMESTLLFLKRELRPYSLRPSLTRLETITLQSKNCMTVSVPGCYCMEGYIEDLGRCMKPANCSKDAEFENYLKRIILH